MWSRFYDNVAPLSAADEKLLEDVHLDLGKYAQSRDVHLTASNPKDVLE